MTFPSWVYAIRLDSTGKVYVGISSNPKKRLSGHRSALRAGTHPVEDFQDDYNRLGGSLSFCIIEKVQTREERSKEFKWQLKLRSLERSHGYNYKDPVTKWLFRE